MNQTPSSPKSPTAPRLANLFAHDPVADPLIGSDLGQRAADAELGG
jgi:hypothetical protein